MKSARLREHVHEYGQRHRGARTPGRSDVGGNLAASTHSPATKARVVRRSVITTGLWTTVALVAAIAALFAALAAR